MTIDRRKKVRFAGNVTMEPYAGNPDTVLTRVKGSLALDTSNAKVYQNTDGATAWTELGTGAGGPHDPWDLQCGDADNDYIDVHCGDADTDGVCFWMGSA